MNENSLFGVKTEFGESTLNKTMGSNSAFVRNFKGLPLDFIKSLSDVVSSKMLKFEEQSYIPTVQSLTDDKINVITK